MAHRAQYSTTAVLELLDESNDLDEPFMDGSDKEFDDCQTDNEYDEGVPTERDTVQVNQHKSPPHSPKQLHKQSILTVSFIITFSGTTTHKYFTLTTIFTTTVITHQQSILTNGSTCTTTFSGITSNEQFTYATGFTITIILTSLQ